MSKRTLALLAAFTASFIYAVNHTIAKGIMPTYIKPFGFIFLRVTGASVLFWMISFMTPSERIDKKDWLRVLGCAICGMVINMLMFFKGLELSTPINSAVMITISPILVFILSVFIIKEKITLKRTVGILLGCGGALGLTLFGIKTKVNAPNIPLGNVLFLVNATSYAIYLILVKPLAQKYKSVTLMKWFFLIAIFINFPITIQEFSEVDWFQLPSHVISIMIFVVVGTTFLTYLLNVYALKTLKASTIAAFIYLQPLLAILFAVSTGVEKLQPLQLLAALLVFLGVYLVTSKVKTS